MLLTVKKVNQGQRKQIRTLIRHANISDSMRVAAGVMHNHAFFNGKDE
jgi:hypothetical protein